MSVEASFGSQHPLMLRFCGELGYLGIKIQRRMGGWVWSGDSVRVRRRMLLDLSKVFSFVLSLMSLYPVLWNAFFVPGSRWEDRLWLSFGTVGAVCVRLLCERPVFCWPSRENPEAECALLSTLPVRMFAWAVAGMAVLFVSSWYLDVYYVPLLWKNLP